MVQIVLLPDFLVNVPITLNNLKAVFFGPEGNEEHCGISAPPEYDLSNVKVSVALFLGDKNDLATVADGQTLSDHLPNVSFQIIDFEGFTLMDFVIAILM